MSSSYVAWWWILDDDAGAEVRMAPIHEAAKDGDMEMLRRLVAVEGVGREHFEWGWLGCSLLGLV